MQKLFRIGQVCNLYGISLDTLRYYDRKGLLKPIVDKDNGYRYYSLEHLDVLEMLMVGKYLEIPLEQMKEKIETESIDGYLSMMEEQSRLIREKLDLLNRLSLYTKDMTDLMENIKKLENDYTFSNVEVKRNIDIIIYNMDIENYSSKGEKSQMNGIEAFEQWFAYCVDDKGEITENSRTVGLSINSHIIKSDELSEYLDHRAEEGRLSKHNIRGDFRYICFWGKEHELREYLHSLCSNFKLKNTILNIKFRFALLHKNMEHEYFVEIYFTE